MTEFGLRNPDEERKSFSGGQIQRLAIARCLYKKKEFLILDETLNVLEEENSIKILKDFKKKSDLTILLISHNDILASQMDKIIKIENITTNET